jgi:hypothetical protein
MSAVDVRHGLFCYGVPTLQCLVACVQRYLVLYHDLDIWKSVGFGMFSAISALEAYAGDGNLINTWVPCASTGCSDTRELDDCDES